jgi:hypothetical protein
MIDESSLDNVVDALRARYPEASIAVDHFPSSAFMMDVRLGGRLFVMSYAPRLGFAVGEVRDGDSFDAGKQTCWISLEQAVQDLVSILDNAT